MLGRYVGWLVGVALWCGALSARAAEEIRPGVALPPELLGSEAAKYEALLQGHELEPGDHGVELGDDSVGKRRHFDDRRFYFGVGLGGTFLSTLVSASLEVNVWDRLALGMEGGVSFWGTGAGPYARLRPIVWSGRGHRALSALTLAVGYRYMAYGEIPFAGVVSEMCHGSDCDRPYYLNHMAHFVGWELGTEHAFWRGWSVRWAVGAQHLVVHPDWHCSAAHQPAACTEEEPMGTLPVASFVVSHALF